MRAELIVDIQKPRFGVHEICFGDNLLLNFAGNLRHHLEAIFSLNIAHHLVDLNTPLRLK